MSTSAKWRITLGELTSISGLMPDQLDFAAEIGALGSRYTEKTNRWRNITKEAAQRAQLFAKLLEAGVETATASTIAAQHERNDRRPMFVDLKGGNVLIVNREDLL